MNPCKLSTSIKHVLFDAFQSLSLNIKIKSLAYISNFFYFPTAPQPATQTYSNLPTLKGFQAYTSGVCKFENANKIIHT